MPLNINEHKIFARKSVLQVPDTGTQVLGNNTGPFLRSSIVSFWLVLTRSREHKYYIFGQYWYTRNVSSIHHYWDIPVSGTWSTLFSYLPYHYLHSCFSFRTIGVLLRVIYTNWWRTWRYWCLHHICETPYVVCQNIWSKYRFLMGYLT